MRVWSHGLDLCGQDFKRKNIDKWLLVYMICIFMHVCVYFSVELLLSACIMVVHIMCLTTSGGLPLFTRKRGDCEPLSITATYSSCIFLCYAFC